MCFPGPRKISDRTCQWYPNIFQLVEQDKYYVETTPAHYNHVATNNETFYPKYMYIRKLIYLKRKAYNTHTHIYIQWDFWPRLTYLKVLKKQQKAKNVQSPTYNSHRNYCIKQWFSEQPKQIKTECTVYVWSVYWPHPSSFNWRGGCFTCKQDRVLLLGLCPLHAFDLYDNVFNVFL